MSFCRLRQAKDASDDRASGVEDFEGFNGILKQIAGGDGQGRGAGFREGGANVDGTVAAMAIDVGVHDAADKVDGFGGC